MKLKKYPYSDILGWSASRYDKFSSCKRQYYFEYYAKRHDKEIDKKLLFRLRNLSSSALEVGNIVHDVIKAILERLMKSSSPIQQEKLMVYGEKMVDTYCDSKEFHEVFYAQVTEIDKNYITQQVKDCINALLLSERFSWLLQNALEFSEDWLVEPDGYGETRIEGLKAYCKVDFCFRIGDKIYIVDWKTGKEDLEKQTRQMKGYTAFAMDHFSLNAENVICLLFFLKDQREVVLTFTNEEIKEFTQTILNETNEMYAYTQNINQNIPIDKSNFELTQNTNVCRFCNYYALCFA